MNKRSFLKSLLGVVTGLASKELVHAQPASARITQRLLLQTSPLAGFQFHTGQKLWKDLKSGDELVLYREPDNRYDARAVAVLWRGNKLGYIPRGENVAITQLMDRGELLFARIQKLQESSCPWERVQVAVELTG